MNFLDNVLILEIVLILGGVLILEEIWYVSLRSDKFILSFEDVN